LPEAAGVMLLDRSCRNTFAAGILEKRFIPKPFKIRFTDRHPRYHNSSLEKPFGRQTMKILLNPLIDSPENKETVIVGFRRGITAGPGTKEKDLKEFSGASLPQGFSKLT